LLSARSKKEVAKKAKEIYLCWEMCNKEAILERIKSLIQEYKVEDKGSSE